MLDQLEIRNFRLLENIKIKTNKLNVLFGPNGAGKSTFLDAIWFIRDCVVRGVDLASADRGHGIGALWDGADEGANIEIKLETERARYEVLFGFSSGRIESFAGEILYSKEREKRLIDRKTGDNKANFHYAQSEEPTIMTLRE
ncbi:MAG: AAA family ATPase, partial [Desulfobacterales bacterium]|nr:AAA family ATPase [Desulfobacterales bacterium]